ncbi:MAG TPA: sn-glycerol-3-phosphate ABC transporter ATP-binding protein UgpC [Tepidisphaeraceae bacterium]|jgi:multiple sugar transport system ATP-binding protein|nr:sn-glycerol-3-phosphate ABC transporter ATP-binding protein UgpC [Tepidisphaeraceae bacterium]
MARVQLDKITKVYPGGVKAVDAIDLVIADQEFVVLVGPSGCGKTTTLRMIAGLEEITAGEIRIGDRVVNGVPPKDRDIAMVFQNYALYPHMTVRKNMSFGLRLRMLPGPIWRMSHPTESRRIRGEINSRVTQAARILEIEHLMDRKPRQLSGGQRQRVAVGRAIVREPAAFLFDEPLSNLDAKLRVTTRAELKRLHRRLKTTTIYVTHDQEEAMTLGDRIVVMKDGVIQQADTPLVTYNVPANRFVAGFIGMPPMNFFDGAIWMQGDVMVFQEGKLQNSRPIDHASAAPDEDGMPIVGDGELTLSKNGFTIVIPPYLRERLETSVGRHVVLGIRPEHLHIRPSESATPIQMKLNVIEPLGNNMDVYASTVLHDQVVARVEAQEGLQIDTQIALHADLRKIHFFAPGATGTNLSKTSEPAHALA